MLISIGEIKGERRYKVCVYVCTHMLGGGHIQPFLVSLSLLIYVLLLGISPSLPIGILTIKNQIILPVKPSQIPRWN